MDNRLIFLYNGCFVQAKPDAPVRDPFPFEGMVNVQVS